MNVGVLGELRLVALSEVVHVVAGAVPESHDHHAERHRVRHPEVVKASDCQEMRNCVVNEVA